MARWGVYRVVVLVSCTGVDLGSSCTIFDLFVSSLLRIEEGGNMRIWIRTSVGRLRFTASNLDRAQGTSSLASHELRSPSLRMTKFPHSLSFPS